VIAWLKRWTVRAALVLGALAVAGALVVAAGVVPVKASSGHWAITAWLLHFAMERSIATHTATMEPPDTREPWRVMQGAGHYEDGCRPCHGSPGRPMPRIPAAMTPHPPALAEVVAESDPEALFYVVKHGVKFTGMPAWPAQQRDDEVRSMVAFLLALPGMDEATYRELVHGVAADGAAAAPLGEMPAPTSRPPAPARPCVRCHGVDGNGRGNAAFPKLAGQTETYLFGALQAYASARRHSGMMEPVAAPLDEDAMRELARYYAALGDPGSAPRGAPGEASPVLLDERGRRGARIAREGVRERGVPSCASCHGPGESPRNPAYPRLGGQYADFLAGQLRLLAAKARGGTSYVHIMQLVAARLTEEQIRDVAAYYAAQAPPAEPLR
jgi:cytochrome c553